MKKYMNERVADRGGGNWIGRSGPFLSWPSPWTFPEAMER